MPEDPVSAGLTAVADALKLAEQLQAEKNTPQMVKAKADQNAVDAKDKIIKDVAAEDTAAVQKDIAE